MQKPTLEDQLKFQRQWYELVKSDPECWPQGELEYAEAILESLERLNAEAKP